MQVEMLIINLEIATKEIAKRKKENITLRFRVETCVNKDTVKVYVIRKNKIITVLTCYDGSVFEKVVGQR